MHFDTAVGVRSPEIDWVSFFIRALWNLPLLLVVCAWITLYLRRRKSPPAFAALISLGCTTAPAVVAVGGLIYYTLRPAPMTPWPPSYYRVYAEVLFLSLGSGVVACVLWRSTPKWLLGIEIFVSGCLLVLSLLAASTV
jgi:hypothetical protein